MTVGTTAAEWERADPIIDHGPFTVDEMLAFIRDNLTGRTPYVLARVTLQAGSGWREVSSQCQLPVTPEVAVKYVTDTMRWAEKYDVRMKVALSARCMFLGG